MVQTGRFQVNIEVKTRSRALRDEESRLAHESCAMKNKGMREDAWEMSMSERQIQKLRNKFIRISTLSFFGVMLLMGGCIYLFSEMTLRNEVRQIMEYIIENDGELDSWEEEDESEADRKDAVRPNTDFDEHMIWSLKRLFGSGGFESDSYDFIQTTSYFAVLFDADDEVEKITASHITNINEDAAERYARIAERRFFDFGSFGRFYYRVASRENGGYIVVYVDRTGQVAVNNRILFAVLILLGAGTLLAFLLMRIFSVRYVRGEIENAEKQKQFITNASHELKTPLSVIRANTEMQEILEGESEWTASTMRQVDRMSGLIENLVKIARAQEMESAQMQEVNVSRAVDETADTFLPVVAGEGKKLQKDILPDILFVTDESVIRQLSSLLLDNAVKYCDADGCVTVSLKKTGKQLSLAVSNTFSQGEGVDYTRFFERFYRADESHNEQRRGYGIGLSIAEGLVKTVGGSIDVSWKGGEITFRILLKERKILE